ncbi:hypothetical protein SK128_020419 [Halocaridina rubra]|uniref:Uncharacterized protein n=1 Tax=Halocaridina rubra TaxID=373956 RepID=A0AAN9FUF6_HALRR
MTGLESELMLSTDFEGEEQQPDHVEGFAEVTSKEEGSKGMQDQQQGKQRRDQQEGDHRYAAAMRYDDSCRSRRMSGAGSKPGGAVVSSLSDSDTEDEDDPQAADNSGGAVAGSQHAGWQALYFLATTCMDFHQKLMWAVKLCKSHKDFEVLFKEGR